MDSEAGELSHSFGPSERPVSLLHDFGPDDPPWGSWTAVGVWLASVAFILVIPSLFLLPYLASIRPPLTDSQQLVEFAKTDPTSLFIQIIAILPAHALTVLLAWLIITRVRKFSFTRMVGWESGGIRWWYYPAFLIVFFIVAGLVQLVVPEQDNDLLRILRSSRSAVYVIAFVATFTAPFVEEVIYRGVLYSAFQRAAGVPAAFLLVTALFAAVHVPQYYPSFSTIFLLTLPSLMLTYVRVWSGNLWPCIVLHTLFNGIQSFFLLVQPITPKSDAPDPTAIFFHLFK